MNGSLLLKKEMATPSPSLCLEKEPEPIWVFVAGEPFVGKSHFIQHLALGDEQYKKADIQSVTSAPETEFIEDYELPAEAAKVQVRLLDTPGQTRFDAIMPMYLRLAEVVVLVFALDKRKTFESLRTRWPINKEHCTRNPVVVLIGNKLDEAEKDNGSQRRVATAEAGTLALEVLGASAYYELSAKCMQVRHLRLPLDIALGAVVRRRREARQQQLLMHRMSSSSSVAAVVTPPPPRTIVLGVTPSANPLWTLDEIQKQTTEKGCCS